MQRSKHRKYTCSIYALWLVLLSVLSFAPLNAFAQDEAEEIIVSVGIQGAGITELPAVIKGNDVYLPIVELFDFLKIKNTPGYSLDSISGFFINESARFLVVASTQTIYFADKSFDLKPDGLIKTETGIYLNIKYLGEIFGLESKFNFRALLVNVTTTLELPVVREARLAAMRSNVGKLKGDFVADTTLPRSYPFLRLGMVDWSLVGTEQIVKSGKALNDLRIGLGLGAMLAGGETNIILNHSTSQPFESKRQFYLWRMVDNNKKLVKQASVGKIPINATSSIFAPVVGAQITNGSTVFRRSFGSFTLSDVTEPGWIVELYVNGSLVDYAQADPSGFFSFQVPLVYGSSVVKLKFYGPYGEERARERNINVPLQFLPKGKFEYTASAGVLEDDSSSIFSKGIGSYGLSKRITIGGGVEYLTTVKPEPLMPFMNIATRISNNILLGGEYTHNVRARSNLSYRHSSNLQLDLLYTKYKAGQTAVNTLALEERRASLSTPIKGLGFSMFTMFNLTQNILANSQYTNTEWLLSGIILGLTTNITTYGVFVTNTSPFIYSNISFGYPLPRLYTITAQTQYDYTNGAFISGKTLLEKRYQHGGYVGISYEQNFKSNITNLGLQLRYELQSMQLSSTTYKMNDMYNLLQSARGSILIDDQVKYVGFKTNTNVARGAAVIVPFLDLNCDGKADPGEPKVTGLRFRTSSGKIMPEGKDSTVRVLELEPYTKCYIELNRFSFDNIAWQIRNKSIAFTVAPNAFTRIEVPVSVVAEATGMVYIKKNGNDVGQGGVTIVFIKDGVQVAKTITEPDGYFSYIGLVPGEYTVSVDSAQMQRINMTSSPALSFSVFPNIDGTVIQDLEFRIQARKQE